MDSEISWLLTCTEYTNLILNSQIGSQYATEVMHINST